MKKRLFQTFTALTLSSLAGIAITKKVFPEAVGGYVYGAQIYEAKSNPFIVEKNTYTLKTSDLEKMVDVSVPLNTVRSTIADYDFLFDLHSGIFDPIDTALINILINKRVYPDASISDYTKPIEVDMSDSVKVLRKLPKEKFYFEHQDQFLKDSLALMDIVNRIDLYSEVVSKDLVVALLNEESHFFVDPGVSIADARGPMQVTEIGWKTVERNDYLPNVDNPQRNILAGVKICRWLEDYCSTNNKKWEKSSLQRKQDLIVAAYNCGIGTLTASKELAEARQNNDSIFIANRHPWYIDETPQETRDHVVKVRKTLEYLQSQKFDQKKLLAYNSK